MADSLSVARMSQPVTELQFYKAMGELRDQIDAVSQRLLGKLEAHAEEDRAIADRVLVLETKSGSDARWSGGLVAVAVTAAGWFLNWLRH